jgi:argininosuccinate lyase
MRRAATEGYLNATELADYMVRKGMPFRSAHEAVGRLVLLGIETGRELGELSLEELRGECDQVQLDVFDSISLDQTLASKSNIGGTSQRRVAEALAAAANTLNTVTSGSGQNDG